ncbi:MAG: IclR family transcriptional regulator [Syntrophorhabdaceae bacterium]|nr:IclR family transcriptional regulator [Syntrophorhabdaceae bacterium]
MYVKSADRVIQIFEALSQRENGMTHAELSKTLAIPKGSLTHLLSNLVDREYLLYDKVKRVYSLGPRLLILTGRYLLSLDIVRVSRPIIQDLVAEINEDTELAIMKGDEIIFVYKEQCSHPLKYSIEIGDRAPMYATGAGKAILAHLSEEEIKRYLSRIELIPMTKNTITDRGRLDAELMEVKKKGIAYSREEYQQGISAIAAPVFNFYGNVIGSITVTLPSIRFTYEQKNFIEPRLLDASRRISQHFGFEEKQGKNHR